MMAAAVRDTSVVRLLRAARVVFWDFDGVIKDSVEVKSLGFEKLFAPYGRELAGRVRAHHEAHGGMSRYQKIPLYLGWAGEPDTAARVQEFCDRFAQLVRQAVIDSPWVPGVREYLQNNCGQQIFVLVTATPQEEIQEILQTLGMAPCFEQVCGAPTEKAAAVAAALQRLQCAPEHAVVVGDSEAELRAAAASGVVFLLRRTALNQGLQRTCSGPMFDNLSVTHEQTNQNSTDPRPAA